MHGSSSPGYDVWGYVHIDTSPELVSLWMAAIEIHANSCFLEPGLGFCHGKKYFCQDSGKNR